MRRRVLSLLAIAACAVHGAGTRETTVFTQYSTQASNAEVIRRLLTPMIGARVLAAAGTSMRAQAIKLADEKFSFYVPPTPPPDGYALLVFIPPWNDDELPHRFDRALDRAGMIFVSATRAGNDEDVLDRRVPLALLAAANMMSRYPVDPKRVYIGGLSGGSRVALRVALGYPDVFHGALLNAGSDPIGVATDSLPPAELFAQFQEATRLVYVTGSRDELHFTEDIQSRESMERWCVYNIDIESMAQAGHELARTDAFERAIADLAQPIAPEPGKLAACRARITTELDAELARAERLVAAGKSADARHLLIAIDERFGGLAGPRVLALLARLRQAAYL